MYKLASILLFGALMFASSPVFAASYESDVGLTFDGAETSGGGGGGTTPTDDQTEPKTNGSTGTATTTNTGTTGSSTELPKTGDEADTNVVWIGSALIVCGMSLMLRKAQKEAKNNE